MRCLNAGSLRCVIGHSLGGILAVAYSASRLRPIERLALFATPFPVDPATNYRRFLRSPMKRLMVHHRLLGRLTHQVGCRLFPLLLRAVHGGRYPREILQDFHKHTHHSYTDTAERCLFRFDVRLWLGAVPDLSAFLTYSDIDREVPVADAERYATALTGSHCHIVHRDHELVPFGSETRLREWLQR